MPTKVDMEKCTGCGVCENVCPTTPKVYAMKEVEGAQKAVVVEKDACTDCGACVSSCPVQAITMLSQ
jgi:NAD-dependent dihydropyrimidine dehydrogenase PreA subunit